MLPGLSYDPNGAASPDGAWCIEWVPQRSPGSPTGAIEPCPIIQFAKESVRTEDDLFNVFTKSEFLRDFREAAASATRGCIVLERPDIVRDLVQKHGATDSTQRGTAMREFEAMTPRRSQHQPGAAIPEEHWAYRFAKKHWFFGFGAYS